MSPLPNLNCETCSDTGLVPADKGVVRCACATERQIRQTLPERFHTAKVSELPLSRMQPIMAWLNEPGDGLLLYGPTGTGKTWAAAGITRMLIEADRRVLWRSAAEFFRALRGSYECNRSEGAILKKYATAPFLILDDLGAGSSSDFERRTVMELVDRRMNRLLPTVVTTNWTLEQIAERLDDRLASRLSGFTRLEFVGPDRRSGPRAPQP